MKRFIPTVFIGSLAIAAVGLWSVHCGTRSEEPPPRDGGAAVDGGPRVDGGGVDGGAPVDGGTATDTTITQIQNGAVVNLTCVRVSAVVMSLVFDDRDNTFLVPDAGTVPRKAFYISEKNLTQTAPRTGLEVVVNTDVPTPSVSPGDDVTITAEYNEFFDYTTLRMTAFCGSLASNGAPVATPTPRSVTIAEIGQTGNTAGGCTGDGGTCTDGTLAEDYEGVLVRITAGTVTAPRDGFGNFEVKDATDPTARLQVNTNLGVTVAPNVNDTVTSITGFGHFSFRRRKLRPRNDAETVVQSLGPNCGNDPKVDHLLITEVKISPTPGEFVEIHNPTGSSINLSNYYLYNATHPGGTDADGGVILQRRYYYITQGGGAEGGTSNSDFSLRFPDGATIGAGEYQVIAITGALNYCNAYFPGATCDKPNYEIPPPASDDTTVPNMRGAFDANTCSFGTGSCPSGTGFLTGLPNGEELVLFQWDGVAPVVEDVDYLIWGSRLDQRTDKTAVTGYQADTPIASQQPLAGATSNPATGQSFQRICMNEGTETKSGGNGITAHNETGENLSTTWVVAPITLKAGTVGAIP
jgi:hypothetical protein